MRVTYRRELDVKNLLDQQGVSSFIPMHYVIRMAKKRKVRELVPVVHNLIFIHITQTDMKELKKIFLIFSIWLTRVAWENHCARWANEGLHSRCRHVWRASAFFKPEEINPAKGTRVRIIGGDFAGYEGIFIKGERGKRPQGGHLHSGNHCHAMATISPDLIEVIKEPKKKWWYLSCLNYFSYLNPLSCCTKWVIW